MLEVAFHFLNIFTLVVVTWVIIDIYTERD